jgi:regulatory protein
LKAGVLMKITSIEKRNKNKDKIAVYIDHSYSFTISEEDYISLNLYEEIELTDEQINNIKNNVNYRSAKSEAVKYVSYKFRSKKEVFDKLLEEGYEEGVIEKVIEELAAMGYINDKIYAQKFIFDRTKLKPKSSKLLKLELGMKGIESDIVDEVLLGYEVDDYVTAEGLAKKKFGKYDMTDEKIIKKIRSFLQHRGFDYDIINRTLKELHEYKG